MSISTSRTGTSAFTADTPNQTRNLPPPASDDNAGDVNKLKATGTDGGRPGVADDVYLLGGRKLKDLQDAQWWLEPAGYSQFKQMRFKDDEITGVFEVTDTLYGVTTKSGEHYWVSNFHTPIAFAQGSLFLDDRKAELEKEFPGEDIENTLRAGGYKEYGVYDGFNSNENMYAPHDIKYAWVAGDYAACIAHVTKNGNTEEEMVYIHRSNYPDIFSVLEKGVDELRKKQGLNRT